MNDINNITFSEIKKILKKNSITPVSDIKDNEIFLSINSISNANNTQLTFLSDLTQLHILKKTNAKACLININYINYLPKKTKPIIVENPYNSFAILSNLFKKKHKSSGNISNLSTVSSNSYLSGNVQIDPFVVIKENCRINNNVIIESNCIIGPNVKIADNTIIKSNSVLLECSIGSNCVIKSGAIIGGTGFGFDPISKSKIEHFGNVIIGDNCNIGSNTTIDRAVFDSTLISNNSFLDNLIQIAHNVVIGKGAIIAAQSGIAGSTKIGDNVLIGGQAGISGHLSIGNNVTIAGKSGVTKNIANNSTVAGFPAIDIKKWKLMNIKLNKSL